MHTDKSVLPELGFGLGLRPLHYRDILDQRRNVDWFEIISENFMDTDSTAKRTLTRIREHYPIAMHGVALSIGTIDPLNSEYLTKLERLIEMLEPSWVSDHLCWTGMAHTHLHDLLPVPYTQEALEHIITRIDQVQHRLQRPIALENPSTYLEFNASYIPEAEFISQMVKRTGCQLLLDVNNVYVSCYNHQQNPQHYIDTLPLDSIIQVHLAGHHHKGTHIIDSHDTHVAQDVWSLYQYLTHKAGRTLNTMIEWDDNIPPFETLITELHKAKHAANEAQHFQTLPSFQQTPLLDKSHPADSLYETQKRMQESILSATCSAYTPDSWIRSKPNLSAEKQLAIYINAYHHRMRRIIAEDYPALNHYLGTELFHKVIALFVNQTPSRHFNISRYTLEFHDFLVQHDATDLFACALAKLESAITVVNDEAETEPLMPEHLASSTPKQLMHCIIRPRKALKLLAFPYPVNAYYQAIQQGETPLPPAPDSCFLAVFRHEDTVWRMELAADEYTLLCYLFAEIAVGDALEKLQQQTHISSELLITQLPRWFTRWVENGLIATLDRPIEPVA